MNSTPTSEDIQIRKCIEAWTQALRVKDINALMAHYAPANITFDLRPPLQVGLEAYRKNFEAWFASVQGPIGYEIHDLRVTASDEVALCHYLARVTCKRKAGEKDDYWADYWVRVTVGYQKMNGRWMATHEHVSVPVDMKTRRAALDLEP
jgi:ketosteroid isomerase-like protein